MRNDYMKHKKIEETVNGFRNSSGISNMMDIFSDRAKYK
jgi:hypothetical protein